MDVDDHPKSMRRLSAALATGEPQIAVHNAMLRVPELAAVTRFGGRQHSRRGHSPHHRWHRVPGSHAGPAPGRPAWGAAARPAQSAR
ncbi:hypothetical protein ACWDG9_22950 [Streptomyces sp. NPDC001073]